MWATAAEFAGKAKADPHPVECRAAPKLQHPLACTCLEVPINPSTLARITVRPLPSGTTAPALEAVALERITAPPAMHFAPQIKAALLEQSGQHALALACTETNFLIICSKVQIVRRPVMVKQAFGSIVPLHATVHCSQSGCVSTVIRSL